MGGFHRRNAKHDVALAAIVPILKKYGLHVYPHGIEFTRDLKNAIQHQGDDPCSLMLRWRPDMAALLPKDCSTLCEVKASWHIEARSLKSIQTWNDRGNIVMLAVYDEGEDDAFASWLHEITVGAVKIPTWHHDWTKQPDAMHSLFPEADKVIIHPRDDHRPLAEIRDAFPTTKVCPWGRANGSGTPFVRLKKGDFDFLDSFICREILCIPDPRTGQAALTF